MRPTIVVHLDQTGVILLQGKDVRRFCNGMFTNNARDLAAGAGQRTGMCDAKGRLLGLMDLYAVEGPGAGGAETFLAVLEGVTAAEFEERYGKYIVFDDVELTDRTPHVAVLTVQGPDAAAILARAGLQVPGGVAVKDGLTMLRKDRGGGLGFDVIAPIERAQAVADALLAAGAAAGSVEELEILRVEAGKVRWPVDAPGRVFPAELGLRDEILHFEKGCYIGQETINRIDVMGEVRRMLVGVRVNAELPSGDWDLRVDGKSVGKLTSAVRSPSLGWIGLAMVRKPADEPGTKVTLVCENMSAEGVVAALPFAGAGGAAQA
jgi:folate-binding protein YgfZ